MPAEQMSESECQHELLRVPFNGVWSRVGLFMWPSVREEAGPPTEVYMGTEAYRPGAGPGEVPTCNAGPRLGWLADLAGPEVGGVLPGSESSFP